MITTKELKEILSKEKLATLFESGVTQRDVAKKYGVYPSRIHLLANFYGIKPLKTTRHKREYKSPPKCWMCGETDKMKFYRTNLGACKSCQIKQGIENKRKFREFVVNYKGGKCIICGYNKHFSALDFHHINPDEKDAKITKLIHQLKKPTLEKIQEELDKCVLLCANCHREFHWGVLELPTSISP